MGNIVLYSTNCPKCNVLMKKLQQSGIDFDLVEDADVMIQKGFMSAPILEVDGNAMDFMSAINWVNGRANA